VQSSSLKIYSSINTTICAICDILVNSFKYINVQFFYKNFIKNIYLLFSMQCNICKTDLTGITIFFMHDRPYCSEQCRDRNTSNDLNTKNKLRIIIPPNKENDI